MAEENLIATVRQGNTALVRDVLSRYPQAVHDRDVEGATALHYAAEAGYRSIVALLLDAGADINARDGRFGATPSGWAIEYLRAHGGVLGMEIDDVSCAISNGDVALVERYLTRLPALKDAAASDGRPLREQALVTGNPDIIRIFGPPVK